MSIPADHAAVLLQMATINEGLADRYQAGLTPSNAHIVQPAIDENRKRAEALRAGAAALTN